MCKKPTKQQCSLRNTSCLGILGSNDGNTHTQYAQMIRSWLMRQLFNEYETATNITGWWFEPSWKIWVRQWEGLSHTLWKIEHVWNHQSDKGSFPLPNHTQTEGTWPAAWKKNHPTEPPPGSSRQQSQNLSVSPVELLWPGSTFSKPFWTAAMGQKWSKDVKRFNTEICKMMLDFFQNSNWSNLFETLPTLNSSGKQVSRLDICWPLPGQGIPCWIARKVNLVDGCLSHLYICIYIYIMSHFNAFHRFWSIHGPRLVESSPLVMMSK